MTGIVGLVSGDLNEDLYKYIGLMGNRGNVKSFYSDSLFTEINKLWEENPNILMGKIGVACCGFNNTNYICFPGYTVVFDGELHASDFEHVKDPLLVINNLIQTSDKKFFGIYISEKELYAFKDKTGSKPGMYGFDAKGNIVICSENVGFKKTDDIYGGEIMYVKDNIITRKEGNRSISPNIYEYIFFAKNTSNIYGLDVDIFRSNMSSLLLKHMDSKFGVVFGACDKSRLYGLTIANTLKIPYIEARVNPLFRGKFSPNVLKYQFDDIHFKYDNILIVDIFIASGNTAKFFVDTFKSKRCDNITLLSLSPKGQLPNIGPKIIEQDKLLDPEDANDFIGCKVIYNTDENLKFVSGFEQISY